MHRAPIVLAALPLLAALAACGGGGGGGPPPPLEPVNLLRGTFSGGAASVVSVTAYDGGGEEDAALVYDWDLTEGCAYESSPQGTLCDEAPTADSLTASTKSLKGSGATWDAGDGQGGLTTGVLVVDACHDGSCDAIDFSEARVFQMFYDGVTTHIRLSVHPSASDVPPAWDSSYWSPIGDGSFSPVYDGTTADLGVTVTDPTVLDVGAQRTRYLRIEVRNDGSLGDAGYVELRALKLF